MSIPNFFIFGFVTFQNFLDSDKMENGKVRYYCSFVITSFFHFCNVLLLVFKGIFSNTGCSISQIFSSLKNSNYYSEFWWAITILHISSRFPITSSYVLHPFPISMHGTPTVVRCHYRARSFSQKLNIQNPHSNYINYSNSTKIQIIYICWNNPNNPNSIYPFCWP